MDEFKSISLPLVRRVYPSLISNEAKVDDKYMFPIFNDSVSDFSLVSTIVVEEFSVWSSKTEMLTRFEKNQKLSAYDSGEFWIIAVEQCFYKIDSHLLQISDDGEILNSYTEKLKGKGLIGIQPMSEPSGITFALRYIYSGKDKDVETEESKTEDTENDI